MYYRLRPEDLDGKIQYSKSIIIKVDCSKNAVFIYPNRVRDVLHVNFSGSQATSTLATLYDPSGRSIRSQYLKNGINLINVNGLSKGTYFLHLKGVNSVDHLQVMIQ